MSESIHAPLPGEILDDYEIIEKVGGNMGLVFKARHRLLNKTVALKLLPGDWTKDGERLRRFQREMELMARLDHPHLVKATDARSLPAGQLVAMEWVDGMDLQQLMSAHGRIPISDACEAARQAALGLQHAHEHGLIHRDIKPSNLMLTRAGVLKVIDMGLALDKGETATHLTQSGHIMGTMSYCAPEQLQNASSVDIRADIYSLGCMLYHLLAGKPPYASRKTITEVVQAHLQEPFPKLCQARPDAPEELEAVLMQMTEKDPAARFASPSAVAETLEPFARGADLSALVRVKSPPGQPHGHPAPVPDPNDGRRQMRTARTPWLARTAMGACLLAIAGGIFLWMNRNEVVPVHGVEPPQSNHTSHMLRPIVVLMDTTAKRGIYELDNKDLGRSNAEDLYDLFKQQITEISPESIIPEPVGLNWDKRNRVRLRRPDLILIHRSVFFHPLAAALKIRYRDEWKTPEDEQRFNDAYQLLGDHPLREFIGDIGNSSPGTKFLVYSRGTDTNWFSGTYRLTWIKEIEATYPALKNRITTMLIEGEHAGEQNGTFDEPINNRQRLLKHVREILGLPAKSD